MSNEKEETVVVSIDDWVEKAKADPEAYLERQVTEIFLATLGSTQPYCEKFFLKGGLLMGIVYESPRQTTDIDYTTILDPTPEIAEDLSKTISEAFPSVAASLGYPDVVCKIQTIKHMPRVKGFADAEAPGFKITVGYAKRGTPQEKQVHAKRAVTVLHADVSFKEPVGGIQIVRLGEHGQEIAAYSLKDMIAEKYRAYLQQEKRNRVRRQDIYDLHLLLGRFQFDEEEKSEILKRLLDKSQARGLSPSKDSMSQKELIDRAKSEWGTLELEIGSVPPFEDCFKIALEFYQSLPWDANAPD